MMRWNKLRGNSIVIILFIFLVSVSLAIPVHRWGDATTYYMQTQSIANDFDIQYEQKDLQKAFENRFDDLPAGLFLIKDEEGNYFYGKEFTYALFAAPFFKIFGNNGILLFNALMFFLMIFMGYLFLKRQNSDRIAIIFSICYFFASAAFVYIFWIHTEIYNMFLIMVGLFLWFKSMSFDSGKSINSLKENKSELTTSQTPNNWLFISAAVFGLATFAKIPNAILFLPLLCWELYNKRFKNLILCVLFFVIPIIILFGYFYLTTGALTPYGGDRMIYVDKYPFTDDHGSNNGIRYPFGSEVSSNIFSIIATFNLIVLLYDMFYYLFGRFTGLTWYYMPAIIALYLMIRGKIKNSNSRMKSIFNLGNLNIKHVLILSAIILNALFYIVIGPDNYFGGAHAIGNRWFYIFPAFLFLVNKIKFDKKLVAFFIIAILFTAPININPVGNSSMPCIHTAKMPYSVLPVEYTLLNNLPFWGCSHKIGDIVYYYLDTNTFSQTENIFYIKGSAKTKLLMESAQPLPDYKVDIFSFAKNNKITMDIGGDRKQINLNEFEYRTLIFIPKPTYEREKYIYKISIETTSGDILFSNKGLYCKPVNGIDIFGIQSKIAKMFVVASGGWYNLEFWQGTPTRWTSNNAILFINSSENRNSTVFFNVISFYKPRTLQAYLNDELIHEQKIPTSFVEVEIPLKLKEGENILKFYTQDGCQRPIDIPKLKNEDSRCLSLAFQNIAFTPNFTDYSIPDLMVANSFYLFSITIKNPGPEEWNKSGENPAYVSYHWLKDGKVVLFDGIRNKLPCDVLPGNIITMNMNIETPREKGNYTLMVDLVKEGVTLFETQKAVLFEKNITVTNDG